MRDDRQFDDFETAQSRPVRVDSSGHDNDFQGERVAYSPGQRLSAYPLNEYHETEFAAYALARRQKWKLPVFLFLATCASTFWVAVTDWQPILPLMQSYQDGNLLLIRRLIIRNWDQGLLYMTCVLAILLMHELGHFFTSIFYRVPATMPIFLPFPFNPIGTFGAVIGMQAGTANRRQIFDIGIAGPIAGLVVAIPVAIYGISLLDFSAPGQGQMAFECPLAFRWIIGLMGIENYTPGQGVWLNQLNPFFAAAWVGFLVTGLNMVPIGQLDGGHVTYTLFGEKAHWIAKGLIVLVIAYIIYTESYVFLLMTVLILLIGTDHPPTRDDDVKLGWFRTILGLASLTIPVLCIPPNVIILPS